MGPRRPLTGSETEAWFAKELHAETRFAFRAVETNEMIGFCGITLLGGELDFGYFIRQKFWGQGLVPLMCKLAIAKLAQSIDLAQVKVFIASNNIGSKKVAHKLGWQIICATDNEFESGHFYQICT